jgi:hypothetical protein
MGLQDFEVFVRERLLVWDANVDLSSGSPIDTQVIQPLLRRIGTDPFTVDASTFIVTRLTQEFPDLAFTDGDAVSDLLAKPALLLWDPIIREIQRIKNVLSFRNKDILTTDEADSLGANLFATRDTGSLTRGVGRLYFTQPQGITVTQSNFFTSKGGLHFFPTDAQSIKSTEMVLNIEGDLYYFDVNVVAEAEGDQYNIGSSELVTVANISAAVRVTNKVRFRFGLPAEDASTFIDRAEQGLTEHSMVTSRGIAARLSASFPEITRLNVVGMGDPEMQRDIISGGSLGPLVAYGDDAVAFPDGRSTAVLGVATTRRVQMMSADFVALIGPVGLVKGWVLTLFGVFITTPSVRDYPIVRVIDTHTLELPESTINLSKSGSWCLRKMEITLSGIPGGILFPDTAAGTVSVPPDEIHIGGATDTLVRSVSTDAASVVLDVAHDDIAEYSGVEAFVDVDVVGSFITLLDYKEGVDYDIGDDIYADFVRAGKYGWSIEIIDGPDAGVYRILDYTALVGGYVQFHIAEAVTASVLTWGWRLINEIHIDLVEPKQTRVTGTTGKTTQHVTSFKTTSGVDFDALGVAAGDTLRIGTGMDKGDYEVKALTPPFYTSLTVDRPFKSTTTGLPFSIFKSNTTGGVSRPLLRVTGIDLLDTTKQPVGSKIPYAKPVEVISRSFQNAGNGVKIEVRDATLGIVTLSGTMTPPAPGNLRLVSGATTRVVAVPAAPLSASALVVLINAALGFTASVVLSYGGNDYVGIIPFGSNVTTDGTDPWVATALFGDVNVRTSRDIRSTELVLSLGSWAAVTPTIDHQLDATWVVDGLQSGFYDDQTPGADPKALIVSHDFSPELHCIVKVGSRSIGSARVYFLEPTSAEVDAEALFTTTDANGVILNYKPDPTMERQVYPALPNGTKPLNGVPTPSTGIFQSSGTDFLKRGVREGDLLIIDYVPVVGSLSLADPVLGLAKRQLRLSLDEQTDKFVTFINDVATAGAVSRKGVADQINAAVGIEICSIVENPAGTFKLVFNPTMYLIIRQQSLAVATQANLLLGFSNTADTINQAENFVTSTIVAVYYTGDVEKLGVTPPFSLTAESGLVQFSIRRQGEQRIVSTTMEAQKAPGSLYYWDVELLSEGPGDAWNIDAGLEMSVAGYRSDGYYLTTRDPNLTFSTTEDIQLVISKSILELGVDDDPDNSTLIEGQALSISYDFSSLVQGVQSFVGSESERVINESHIGRHLIPHYVRFDLTYLGGSLTGEVLPPIEDLILAVPPDVPLESSDIQKIVTDKGATSITNPIDLMAVVYNFDRTVYIARSQDHLTTGRLAAFFPDVINLTRSTS